jgi:hypothetical protein
MGMVKKVHKESFDNLAAWLGYDPAKVMSIRMTKRKVVVSHLLPDGMPASCTHEVTE